MITLAKMEIKRVQWDKKLERAFSKEFKRQAKLINKVSTNSIADLRLKINTIIEDGNFQSILLRFWVAMVEDFGKYIYKILSSKKQFSMFAFGVMAYIQSKVFNTVIEINDYTKLVIGRIIDHSIEEGLSIPNMVKIIRGVFDDKFSKARSKKIARTEVNRASNFGSWQGAVQTGLELNKFWIRTFDNRVRKTHKKAHGQTVGMTEPFRVGQANLMFPGDPDGPPEEVINCRCTLGYKEVK